MHKPIITLAPGSVWETKKWGNKKFLKLANKLKDEFNIVLVGSKADKIQNLSENGIIDLIGETSIKDLFHIIKKSIAVITNDSAPTHVASVMNKPVVTIYGPTDPMFGFYPLSKKSVSIKNYYLKCSPCDIHGQDRCPLGTHKCMKSINTNLVIDELFKLNITSTS